jgi:hypothetical protein
MSTAISVRPRMEVGRRQPVRRRWFKLVPREGLFVFMAFTAAYAALGYVIVTSDHVVVFTALDRLTRALMVWHDAPPKLAAIGFTFPPVTSLAYLPFAILKPVATSLLALPLLTAFAAGATMVMLNRVFVRCGMRVALRYPLLLLFGANPEFVFYATNGVGDAIYLFLLAAGLLGLIAWYQTDEGRFLIGAALALSLCMLTRYEFIIWALVISCFVGAALVRRDAVRERVEGSVISYLAPIVYGLVLWTLFNTIIVGSPLGWISSQQTSTLAVNSDQLSSPQSATVAHVTSHLLTMLVGTAPIALLAIPILLLVFLSSRDAMALWLAVLTALGIAIVGADALIQHNAGVLVLSDALPVGLTATVGAAWLYGRRERDRALVWVVTAAALAGTLPLAWHAMQTYPFQNLEQAFVHAVSGGSQEGKPSIGGFVTGIDPELQMARYVDEHFAAGSEHAILTDNAQTYGVIVLSGRPQVFLDRVDQGEARWIAQRDHPSGPVRYMLIAYHAPGDLIQQRYPNVMTGADADLTPVFRTSRYLLVRVGSSSPGLATPSQRSGASTITSNATTTTGSTG